MAYTRVTNTRNGPSAIRYAFEEPSRKKDMDRVLMASGSNLDPNFAMQQMRDVWKAHGKDDGDTVQMYRIIQSFDLNQLDPSNPEHVALANEIGQTLANELYPDKQALIVTQADGEGGKLHNHVLVNSVGFADGKSLRGYRKEHSTIADKSDEILQRHGLTPIDTENTRVKRTSQEKRLAEQGKYVWKDDLRGRVDDVLSDVNVIDRDTFKSRLKDDYDVDVTLGDKRKYVTYRFDDGDGKQRGIRHNRLGTDYGKETLDKRFQENFEKLHHEALAENKLFDEQKVREKQTFKVDSIGFDFGAELEAMRSPKRSRPKATRSSGSDEITKRIEARRETEALAKEIDTLHGQGLIENAHIDANKDNVQFDEQLLEKLQKEQEQAEQEEIQRKQREEQQRQEQLRKEQQEQQRLRNDAIRRINDSQPPHRRIPITDELIKKFIALDGELQGKMTTKVDMLRMKEYQAPFDDKDKVLMADRRVQDDEKQQREMEREEQKEVHQEVVQVQEDEHELEL